MWISFTKQPDNFVIYLKIMIVSPSKWQHERRCRRFCACWLKTVSDQWGEGDLHPIMAFLETGQWCSELYFIYLPIAVFCLPWIEVLDGCSIKILPTQCRPEVKRVVVRLNNDKPVTFNFIWNNDITFPVWWRKQPCEQQTTSIYGTCDSISWLQNDRRTKSDNFLPKACVIYHGHFNEAGSFI